MPDEDRQDTISPTQLSTLRRAQVQNWEIYERQHPLPLAAHPSKRPRNVQFDLATELLSTCADGNAEDMRALLARNAPVNAANTDGLTPLHQVCIDDRVDLAELLVKAGADINARDNEMWTPLHAAVSCGHNNIITFLISNNADLVAVNIDEQIPLDIAADKYGKHSVVYSLLRRAMDKKGITQQRIDHVKDLFLAGFEALVAKSVADDTVRTTRLTGKSTLLHFAACHDMLEAARTLVGHGAEVDAVDADGWTPLHAAVHWGMPTIAHFLVAVGADPARLTAAGEGLADLLEDPDSDSSRRLLSELHREHQTFVVQCKVEVESAAKNALASPPGILSPDATTKGPVSPRGTAPTTFILPPNPKTAAAAGDNGPGKGGGIVTQQAQPQAQAQAQCGKAGGSLGANLSTNYGTISRSTSDTATTPTTTTPTTTTPTTTTPTSATTGSPGRVLPKVGPPLTSVTSQTSITTTTTTPATATATGTAAADATPAIMTTTNTTATTAAPAAPAATTSGPIKSLPDAVLAAMATSKSSFSTAPATTANTTAATTAPTTDEPVVRMRRLPAITRGADPTRSLVQAAIAKFGGQRRSGSTTSGDSLSQSPVRRRSSIIRTDLQTKMNLVMTDRLKDSFPSDAVRCVDTPVEQEPPAAPRESVEFNNNTSSRASVDAVVISGRPSRTSDMSLTSPSWTMSTLAPSVGSGVPKTSATTSFMKQKSEPNTTTTTTTAAANTIHTTSTNNMILPTTNSSSSINIAPTSSTMTTNTSIASAPKRDGRTSATNLMEQLISSVNPLTKYSISDAAPNERPASSTGMAKTATTATTKTTTTTPPATATTNATTTGATVVVATQPRRTSVDRAAQKSSAEAPAVMQSAPVTTVDSLVIGGGNSNSLTKSCEDLFSAGGGRGGRGGSTSDGAGGSNAGTGVGSGSIGSRLNTLTASPRSSTASSPSERLSHAKHERVRRRQTGIKSMVEAAQEDATSHPAGQSASTSALTNPLSGNAPATTGLDFMQGVGDTLTSLHRQIATSEPVNGTDVLRRLDEIESRVAEMDRLWRDHLRLVGDMVSGLRDAMGHPSQGIVPVVESRVMWKV